MRRTLAVASLALLLAGEFSSKWFLVPAALCLLFLLVEWHDANRRQGILRPSIAALYATGVPALFTCAGWLPSTVRLLAEPSLKHLRHFVLNPFLIAVAGFYVLAFWHLSKGQRRARMNPEGAGEPSPTKELSTFGESVSRKRMPRPEDFWREQKAAPDSASREANAKKFLRYNSKAKLSDHA